MQVSSAYCDAKDLPKESLSLAALRRSSRIPPPVDIERFRRTATRDQEAASTTSDAGAEHLTLEVFAVELITDGYKERIDHGNAFDLLGYLRQPAVDPWRRSSLRSPTRTA